VHLILVLASLLLTGGVLAFEPANFAAKKRSLDERITRKSRQDIILTVLSVGGTFVVAFMFLLESAALLAFLGILSRTSEASIALASNYVLFAVFTLLFCSMLLIARTSYETRAPLKMWKKATSWGLLAGAAVIALIALLVSFRILDQGPFENINQDQAIYILTLGVLFQIVAFKILLRYPAIAQLVTREIDAARRANKELRDEIQKRALRAYFGGLAFVLVSMFLLGGVATQRLPVQSDRTLNFIVVTYAITGAIVLGLVLTRYFQHRYIEARKRRAAQGDVIAKKRLTRAEINLRVMYIFSGFFGAVFTIAGLATLLGQTPIEEKFGTDLLITAFLLGVGPYGWHRGRTLKRIRAMDDKFPDFLRDLAESERAGMTLPRALQSASKGVYGALTPEIRHMNAQVEWGVSFSDALQRFSRRVKTPLIERTVALIVEASKAGGNVIDILTAASDDAREIKQILEERKRQMGIYGIIIYIAFMVFLVVVFILSAQFLPAFHEAAGANTGAQVSGASIAAFDPEDFKTVFFHAALIQGIGGGLVSGIMQQGHPLSGLKHSVIMTVLSWFFFRVLIG
jgi:archaeal flagellar protein FlaJ